MTTFILISLGILGVLVLLLGFLLLGALRALGLLRWQLEQLEATTPKRMGRGGLKVGKKAPDFTLPSISGPDVSLHDFTGRKVLLIFMQPGCGPCQRVMPDLNRLHDSGEDQVLVVENGELETVRKWAEEHRPRFPVAVQQHHSLSKKYEIFATPFAFLIDERGIITSRGIASTKQYLGYILNKAGQEHKKDEREDDASAETDIAGDSLAALPNSYSREVEHV